MDTLDPRDDNPRTYGRDAEFGEPDPVRLPGTESTFNAWNYRPDAGWSAQFDIIGYNVEATDGGIGKISEASHAMDESYLVVDTGPWIFGKKVMIPAGTVTHLDHTDRKVYVDRTKSQVKASPEFDQEMYTEPAYRDKVGGYYDETYGGLPPAGGAR